MFDAYARWSCWLAFEQAVTHATTNPGVYIAREAMTKQVVYVGKAGERQGQGVRGRLRVYGSGKGAASGLGEAAFDRALADPAWLLSRLRQLQSGRASRTLEWARAAIERADLEISWASTIDGSAAAQLEKQIVGALRNSGHTLWNK
jgi:hypothetical protein